jgi:hypothetical protein
VAHAPPGPPSAAAAETALGGAAAPAAPGAAPAAAAGAGIDGTQERVILRFFKTIMDWRQVCGRRSAHQRNAGACDSWRQELTAAKFGLGMMIWTRIGGSCLGLLQTKTMPNINEEKSVFSNINEEKQSKYNYYDYICVLQDG